MRGLIIKFLLVILIAECVLIIFCLFFNARNENTFKTFWYIFYLSVEVFFFSTPHYIIFHQYPLRIVLLSIAHFFSNVSNNSGYVRVHHEITISRSIPLIVKR